MAGHWIGDLYASVDICVDGTRYKAGDQILNASKGHVEPMLRQGQAEVRDPNDVPTISAEVGPDSIIDDAVEPVTEVEAGTKAPFALRPKQKKSRPPKEA